MYSESLVTIPGNSRGGFHIKHSKILLAFNLLLQCHSGGVNTRRVFLACTQQHTRIRQRFERDYVFNGLPPSGLNACEQKCLRDIQVLPFQVPQTCFVSQTVNTAQLLPTLSSIYQGYYIIVPRVFRYRRPLGDTMHVQNPGVNTAFVTFDTKLIKREQMPV